MTECTYQVAREDSLADLEELVCSMMRDGWVPQGGICAVMVVTPTYERDGCYAFYQAMTRGTTG